MPEDDRIPVGTLNGVIAFTVAVFIATVALWPQGPAIEAPAVPSASDGHHHAHGARENIVGKVPYHGPVTAQEVAEACAPSRGTAAIGCYKQHLLALLDGKGAVVAFDALEGLLTLDPGVSGHGHSLAHDLGRRAYESYGSIEEALANCSYDVFQGCLHGAIEMYYSELDALEKSDVDVCTVADVTRRALCVHGIGHGLMLYTNANVNGSLGYCDWLDDSLDRGACWGGVFMENLVGYYDAKAGRVHHHSHADDGPPGYMVEGHPDPYYPCSVMAAQYQDTCWLQIVDYLLWRNQSNFEDAAQKCDASPERFRGMCRMRIGTVAYGWTGDVGTAVEKCGYGVPAYRPDCIRGIVDQAVLNHFDADAGIDACHEVPVEDKPVCYSQVPVQGTGIEGSRDAMAEVCDRAEPAYVRVCREAAGLA